MNVSDEGISGAGFDPKLFEEAREAVAEGMLDEFITILRGAEPGEPDEGRIPWKAARSICEKALAGVEANLRQSREALQAFQAMLDEGEEW